MTEEIKTDETDLRKVIDRYNFIIEGLFIVSLLPAITFYLDGNGEWKWFLIMLLISLTFFNYIKIIGTRWQNSLTKHNQRVCS